MLDMRITKVDAANHRIVCEVVRVPKFEGGEPQFTVAATPAAPADDEASESTASADDAPAADEAPVAEASADAAPSSEDAGTDEQA
jgi:small subunit ribosomal protein S1